MIGPPPKTIELLGKEYFHAEAMIQHLKLLRAENQCHQFERDIARQEVAHLKLQALGPK